MYLYFERAFNWMHKATHIGMHCLLFAIGAAWQMLCLKWCMSTNTAYGSQLTNTALLETSCTGLGFHNTSGSFSWWGTDQV